MSRLLALAFAYSDCRHRAVACAAALTITADRSSVVVAVMTAAADAVAVRRWLQQLRRRIAAHGGGPMMYEGANVGPQQGRMAYNGNFNGNFNSRMASNSGYGNSYSNNGRPSYSNGFNYGMYNSQPRMNRGYYGPQMANNGQPMMNRG